MIRKSVFCLLALLSASAALADEHTLSLGAGGGYAIPIGGKKFNSVAGPSAMGSLWLRHKGRWRLGIEGGADYLDFSQLRTQAQYAGVGLLWKLAKDASWNPTFLLGAGYGHAKSDDRFGFKARVGIEHAVKKVLFGAYVNYHVFPGTTSGPVVHALSPMLGVVIPLGGCGCSEEAAVKQAAVRPDKANKQIVVEEEFEDEEEVETETSVPSSDDFDADGDGISNAQDQCPGTPKTLKVTALGCPLEQKVEIKLAVEFAPDSTTITDEYESEIIRVAKLMTDNPAIKGTVEGHTDSQGNEMNNERLSQARADAVRAALVKAGVSRDRLKAKGFGGVDPIASNRTEAGRKKNRRVILSVD